MRDFVGNFVMLLVWNTGRRGLGVEDRIELDEKKWWEMVGFVSKVMVIVDMENSIENSIERVLW